ncbi:hypothetical protein GOBAR_AA35933 [Gossypium barbadense]|uniref:Uncharacterized protein n=1 Tax=Gossypium barbadense TaxID=3634 RepID=A0A2P5W0Z4_GOSBA|nr:hypothetical protein GOBAR_AA35933 [Gossypium barbadense]
MALETALLKVCFLKRYGHVNEACEHRTSISSIEKKTSLIETSPSRTLLSNTLSKDTRMVVDEIEGKRETYGLWMLVERRSQQKSRESLQINSRNLAKDNVGFLFRALDHSELYEKANLGDNHGVMENRSIKRKEISTGIFDWYA